MTSIGGMPRKGDSPGSTAAACARRYLHCRFHAHRGNSAASQSITFFLAHFCRHYHILRWAAACHFLSAPGQSEKRPYIRSNKITNAKMIYAHRHHISPQQDNVGAKTFHSKYEPSARDAGNAASVMGERYYAMLGHAQRKAPYRRHTFTTGRWPGFSRKVRHESYFASHDARMPMTCCGAARWPCHFTTTALAGGRPAEPRQRRWLRLDMRGVSKM